MASHQGGSELLLSHLRLSIKHLLITPFLTSQHSTSGERVVVVVCEGAPVNIQPNSSTLTAMMDVTVNSALLASKQHQRFSSDGIETALSQGHSRPTVIQALKGSSANTSLPYYSTFSFQSTNFLKTFYFIFLPNSYKTSYLKNLAFF